MLPYLLKDTPFPSAESALNDPNGLLAAGGDLSSERLMRAYSQGIFPWYSIDEPILWWSPDPRCVFIIDQFKVKKSVIKTIRQRSLKITINFAFNQVLNECALPRSDQDGTWITDEMIQAYNQLNQKGLAHSVEVWEGASLVGGIYGVAHNNIFCGESMFSRIPNGSKIALSALVGYLKQYSFILIDCQLENPHLTSLGAINISRKEYLHQLGKHNNTPPCWNKQSLLTTELFNSTPSARRNNV